MKRKLIEKRITIGFSKPEIEKLEAYCKVTGRSYTDVIRECVRNLTISTVKQPSS
ncbi:CopG family transcriptional regulator [Hydrococcus rivularis NIES-593]|uniref:CopG family transcriptional regulator n=1 Tax=Hydrococcus rivularis NIES-593 TaxID=1921803 RepID=A0A1U7HHQ4_9CYAN|nr:CopG family transcriptional regulator [Hydrococcus rivularis NIES-593]